MDNKTIFGIVFVIILIISLISSLVMYSSESTDLKATNPKVANVVSGTKKILKTTISVPKPLPNVYWSEFNKTLLDLEQEYILILHIISPINTKLVIPETIITQTNVKITSQDIDWSNVGKTLFELEQQRKDIISLLQEKSVSITK
ncbi:MAG TPA: hypothetical protein ENK59_08780 [Thioploca sp.]|nr:hypothetical protein [Thioploca sp.]